MGVASGRAGEALFHALEPLAPTTAKITGMLLQLGNEEVAELLVLPDALALKAHEALCLLSDM